MSSDSHKQIPRSIDQAFASIQQVVQSVSEVETHTPLHLALNRVLAQDIVSPISVPPHDNSAMDGYAFHSSNLSAEGNDWTHLAVAGKTFAGKAWHGVIKANECVQITTGAVMPEGCDTVIPAELVTAAHDSSPQTITSSIRFLRTAVAAGDNRRRAGEDLMQGAIALAKGSRITPAALGLLASLGIASLPVHRRVRVAYFSTGDEIMNVGDRLREGAIYDSNRYTVQGMLTQLGVEIVDLDAHNHVVGDNPAALETAFRAAAASADVVITSGGVSVGEHDHTKSMMRQLGDVEFWRIAMRPGRPMAVGTLKREDQSRCVLFGLPGNPVAVMVTFLALVRPALQKMMGLSPTPVPLLQAKSLVAINKKVGRTEYQRGIVSTRANGELVVQTTGNQGSGVLSSMVQANGLIVLSHEQSSVAVGDSVCVMMFEGAM